MTVFDQRSGLAWIAEMTRWVKYWPATGELFGCSDQPSGGSSQLTAGRLPDLQSASKSLGQLGRKAFWYKGEFGLVTYCLKYSITLNPSARDTSMFLPTDVPGC